MLLPFDNIQIEIKHMRSGDFICTLEGVSSKLNYVPLSVNYFLCVDM